jgi:hypothetical protein
VSGSRWFWCFFVGPAAAGLVVDLVAGLKLGAWFLAAGFGASVIVAAVSWFRDRDEVWIRRGFLGLALICAFPVSTVLGTQWPTVFVIAVLSAWWLVTNMRDRAHRSEGMSTGRKGA